MIRCEVSTGRVYDIYIGSGLIREAASMLKSKFRSRHTVIVSDSRVAELYLDSLKSSLEEEGIRCDTFIFPAGESSKNWQTLGALLEHLMEVGLTRADYLIALGGGVTGDMTGLAASLYLRGIPFVQMPTTLLADVDSSVGGKTAVDLGQGKNQVGTFWQPSLVLADTDLLGSLPRETFLEGCAESIKYGILGDADLFRRIAAGEMDKDPAPLIAECIRMKARYVEMDERDQGARQFLNLGHTFAHAIEAASHLTISHGQAVAIGMCMAAEASEILGVAESEQDAAGAADPEQAAAGQVTSQAVAGLAARDQASAGQAAQGLAGEIRQGIKNLGLPTTCPFSASELAPWLGADKKLRGSELTLILPRGIGECVLYPIGIDEAGKLLEKIAGK